LDAVVRTGGKQYRVHEGSVLDVATMDVEPGSQVELREVLLVSDGDKVTIGSPHVADAVVVADVIEHGRGKKVISFKYKAKTRYRRKKGHRQGYTKLEVTQIRIGDASAPARRRVAAPKAEAAPESEAADEAQAKAPTPSRRTRATATDAPSAAPKAPARRRRTSKDSD
jgi:large subunit ribosomal protein L21